MQRGSRGTRALESHHAAESAEALSAHWRSSAGGPAAAQYTHKIHRRLVAAFGCLSSLSYLESGRSEVQGANTQARTRTTRRISHAARFPRWPPRGIPERSWTLNSFPSAREAIPLFILPRRNARSSSRRPASTFPTRIVPARKGGFPWMRLGAQRGSVSLHRERQTPNTHANGAGEGTSAVPSGPRRPADDGHNVPAVREHATDASKKQ